MALLDDLVALARIPAPTFAEDARLAWLERRLQRAAGHRRRDAAGNLLWSWGDDERPRLVLAAHVDTVFAAETRLDLRREGDDLVGPGVGDNAAAVAVAVDVVDELLRERALAPGAVVFTVGEEGLGNLRGAVAACAELRPAALVALEGHGLDRVLVDAVGSVRARLRLTGPGGHSWFDRGRPSAVHGLIELAARLLALERGEATLNVGLVSGGTSVNAIAADAELLAELRALDEEPLAAFERELRALSLPALGVASELVGRRPAGRLDRGAPLLDAVRRVRADLGLPDVLEAGSTDANAALAAGIPALALGCAHGSGMHTRNERIDLVSLELGRAQLRAVLEALLVS